MGRQRQRWIDAVKYTTAMEDLRQTRKQILGVACITDKVREARLRRYGHVQRREEEDCVRRILEADVHGQRSIGADREKDGST